MGASPGASPGDSVVRDDIGTPSRGRRTGRRRVKWELKRRGEARLEIQPWVEMGLRRIGF